MAKVLNILVLSYLAIAPGMNADSLIHAVDLCRFTQPAVTEIHEEAACGHHHHDAPQPDDEMPEHTHDEPCGHVHNLTADSGAISISMPEPHTSPAFVSGLDVSTRTPFVRTTSTIEVVRPPPNLGLVGTIVQLV